MIITADKIRVGTQLAEADGFLFDVVEIVKETPKNITVRLCSDFSSIKDHWRIKPDGMPGGIVKTFRKTTHLYAVNGNSHPWENREQTTRNAMKEASFAAQHGMLVRQLTDEERAATPEEYKQEANYEITYNGQLWYSKNAALQDLQELVDYAAGDLQSPRAIMELADQYPWANREQLSEIAGGIRDGLTPEQIAVYTRMEFSAEQMNSIRLAQAAGLTQSQIDLLTHPDFAPLQMDIIKAGYLAGMSQDQVASYAKPEIPAKQMLDTYWEIRDGQAREMSGADTPEPVPEWEP